ncbi:thioredoxin family protein [Cryobacterium ruanii]|uniref:thioredoxin family protein n=1 Tax=Cryobacterium ruanii TaxID=1259197 RepID=UPI001F53FB5E|nr:thioredoxin family protein [Cryobacterium ruanii]
MRFRTRQKIRISTAVCRERRFMVTIELLHIADCPNSGETLLRLERAVEKTMPSNATIKSTLVDSAETAARVLFAGSPTILVDGVDLFPTDGRTNDLACRIYLTPNGLAGSPTEQQIEAALAAHG